MPSDVSVIADPANGAAFVAGMRVAMAPVTDGALRFGGPAGPVLRSLTFGERTEVVSAASARDAVAASVLAAATLVPGTGSSSLMEVLAMWLAGAAFDAPDFMETTLLVARAAGWPPDALFRAPAREVDRLAVHLEDQRRASEWNSLVFAEAPAETIEAVRARFADRLLRRSAAAAGNEESPEERTVAPSLGASRTDRVATRSMSRDTATASESGHMDAPLNATPMAPHQTSLSSNPPETPLPEPAPAHDGTASGDHAAAVTEPAGPPRRNAAAWVRGVHLVAPREEQDRPHRAAPRLGSVAPRESRPALAFSIRSPRPDGARADAESPRTATSAIALPLSNVAAPQPQSGAAAHAVVEPMAEHNAVVCDREPHRETRFPERARVSIPQVTPLQASASHPEDLAAALAALLDDEADLRGVDR